MSKIYAGEVVELREGEFENKETKDMETIMNVVVAVARKLVGDISVTTKHTVVVFQEIADQVKADFKVGDFILFHDVIRNPRKYKTIKQTEVETVDINLARNGTVQKLTKTAYTKDKNALNKLLMEQSELEFTDADRAKLLKKDAADAPADTNLDDVFGQ